MRTERYGKTSDDVNKDNYFDDDDENLDDDSSIEKQSESTSETSSSNDDSQLENSGIKPQTQISRIEAKLDVLTDVIHKIHRMMISSTINSNPTNNDDNNANHDFLTMFPLTTEESMDRFENQLNDNEFRRMVVSIDIFCFICSIQIAICLII